MDEFYRVIALAIAEWKEEFLRANLPAGARIEEAPDKAQKYCYTNGREVYCWDGRPFLEFDPPEIVPGGGRVELTCRGRVFPDLRFHKPK